VHKNREQKALFLSLFFTGNRRQGFGDGSHLVAARRSRPPTVAMSANAADLVPAVEAYLEANGLKETLSAMKAEAKAKKMTPSKTVRARLAAYLEARADRDERRDIGRIARFLRRLRRRAAASTHGSRPRQEAYP
jgi:hypothetical protein